MPYIPRSKISILNTQGGEIFDYKGKSYSGKYFKTSDGKYYAGSNPNDTAKQLYLKKSNLTNFGLTPDAKVYKVLKPRTVVSLANDESIPGFKNIPTPKEYEKGYYHRHFLIRVNSDNYKEINPLVYAEYLSQGKLDKNLYKIDKIKWALKGDVFSINKKQVQSLERKYKGISNIFTIYTEFQKIEKHNIQNRKYPDLTLIPPLLPPSYGLPKVGQKYCGNCSFFKEGHCNKWKAQVKTNYWCASWNPGGDSTNHVFSEFESQWDTQLKLKDCTDKCQEMSSRARFNSAIAKNNWISNCISNCTNIVNPKKPDRSNVPLDSNRDNSKRYR